MGLTFFKHETKIDFIGKRYYSYALSVILMLMGLFWTVYVGGPKMGIDFAGGVIVQVQFAQPVDDEALKKSLDTPEFPGISTQRYGEGGRDYLLRFSSSYVNATQLRADVEKALATVFSGNSAQIVRLELVGPKVGADLTNKALEAMFYSILLIAVYISGRFEQRWMVAGIMAAALWGSMYALSYTGLGMGWLVCFSLLVAMGICWKLRLNFALGAVAGLLHDVLITLGLLSMMGVEIDLNVVAALLTLVGYSLNDTIIVYDRIRENLRATPDLPLMGIINNSVNQTLSRTILTSGTTFVATLALYLLGGGVIHDFALTMLIGVIVGTFSSVYVSSAVLLAMGDTSYYTREQVVYEKPGEHGMV